MAIDSPNIFIGNYGGLVFKSNNYGNNWSVCNGSNTNVRSIIINGSNIFTGGDYGVQLSSNNGLNWTDLNNGLPNTPIWKLTTDGINIFAASDSGVFLSTNNGNTWNSFNMGLPAKTRVMTIAANVTDIFAGTYGRGVWKQSLSVIGINEYNKKGKFKLYPNPSPGSFKIIGEGIITSVEVCNIWGDVVYSDSDFKVKKLNEIKLTNINSGIYFVKIIEADKLFTEKIILE